MSMEQIRILFDGFQNADKQIREAAEKQYNAWVEKDARGAVQSVVSLLALKDPQYHISCITYLRKLLKPVFENVDNWGTIGSPEILPMLLQAGTFGIGLEPTSQLIGDLASVLFPNKLWPDLPNILVAMMQNADPTISSCGILVLSNCCKCMEELLVNSVQQLCHILLACYKNEATHKIACTATTNFCLSSFKLANALRDGGINQALLECVVSEGDANLVNYAVQIIDDCSSFFSNSAPLLLSLMSNNALNAEQQSEFRIACLEVLISFTSARCSTAIKNKFPNTIVQICMKFISECTEDCSWPNDDNANETDEDNLVQAGREVLDRLGEIVEGEMDVLEIVLSYAKNMLAENTSWQYKTSGLLSLLQTVEYVEANAVEGDSENGIVLIDSAMDFAVKHILHPHPRVRDAALHLIGQISLDHPRLIQSEWCEPIYNGIQKILTEDTNEHVLLTSINCFINFSENDTGSSLKARAAEFLQIFIQHLNSPTIPPKRAMYFITAIAVLAGILEKAFIPYYPQVSDIIFTIFKKSSVAANVTPEQKNLMSQMRGRSVEALSLLAYAVGKENFVSSPYAMEFLCALPVLRQTASDYILQDYMSEVLQRFCRVLKSDFVSILNQILPWINQQITLSNHSKIYADDENIAEIDNDDEDEETEFFETKEGFRAIKTSRIEAMQKVLEDCAVYIKVLEVESLPLIQVIYPRCIELYHLKLEDLRITILDILTNSMKIMLQHSGATNDLHNLLKKMIQVCLEEVSNEDDPEQLKVLAHTISSLIGQLDGGSNTTSVVALMLDDEVIKSISTMVIKELDSSSKRIEELNKSISDCPTDSLDEEEQYEYESMIAEEQNLRITLVEILAALLRALPKKIPLMLHPIYKELIANASKNYPSWQDLAVALYLCDDWLEHGEEHATEAQLAPAILPYLVNHLSHSRSEIRQPASYGINIAANKGLINGEQLMRVVENLISCINNSNAEMQHIKAKKKKTDAKNALDNIIAALFEIYIQLQGAKITGISMNDANNIILRTVLKYLPLQSDETESLNVNLKLFLIFESIYIKQANVDNTSAAEFLPSFILIFGKVYKTNVSSEELNNKIEILFKDFYKSQPQQLEILKSLRSRQRNIVKEIFQ